MEKLASDPNRARGNQQKRKAGFIAAVSVTVIWMAFIYYLSDQPAAVSASQSLSVLTKLMKIVAPAFHIETQRIEQYNEMFRTCMHAFVFFVLAVLVSRTVKMRLGYRLKPLLISASICVVYSLLDETHQIFVPGRAFQLSDVLIDAAGTLTGIALYWLLVFIRGQNQKRKGLQARLQGRRD